MPSIHFDIPHQNLLLRKEYIYDMQQSEMGSFVSVKLVEATSYPGHVLTFTALISDKYLFHYLPVNAFATKECKPRSLEESNYFNCPSGELSVSVSSFLKDVSVFSKTKALINRGKYIMTFDWYQDNNLCHLVSLVDGNLILVPSHKIVVGGQENDELPPYKKLHIDWVIK